MHVKLHVAKCKEERALTLSSVFKEKRNWPNGSNPYQRVDNTGQEIQIAAEDGAYQIELEQTDQSPVETADDDQYQDKLSHQITPFGCILPEVIYSMPKVW